MRTAHTFLLLTVALAACSQAPDGRYSLRQSVADAIAPSGYANGGVVQNAPLQQEQNEMVQRAYQSDLARIQAGGQPISVSTVTVVGGMINYQDRGTEYRQSNQVATTTVAECESVALNIPRDKYGWTTIYVTRINGIIYAGQYGGGGCQIPFGAQSFPAFGRYPLQIHDKIIDATITIGPWNGLQVQYP